MLLKKYKLGHMMSMPTLFGDVEKIDNPDLLKTVISNDFLQKKELVFINKHNGQQYVRHYGLMPQGGVAVIDVGKFLDGNFVYATVGINLSRRRYEPYVAIACPMKDFSDMKLIAGMVEQAFNWALANKGVKVRLEPWDEDVNWYEDITMSYMEGVKDRRFNPMGVFGFELVEEKFMSMGKRITRPKNSHDIGDFLIEGTEEVLLAWLHSMVDDTTRPKDMMRAVRAVIELRRTYKISYDAYVKEFKKMGMISRTAYNDYVNMAKDPYFGDEMYRQIKLKVQENFNFCIKD
jgi:hypothetical protein